MRSESPGLYPQKASKPEPYAQMSGLHFYRKCPVSESYNTFFFIRTPVLLALSDVKTTQPQINHNNDL